MINRQPNPKKSRRIDWLVIGVMFIFVMVMLVGYLLYAVYTQSKTSQSISIETTISPTIVNTEAPTFTPIPQPTLPLPSPTPQTYIVKPGDTLSGIASAFGLTVDAIKIANGLSNDIIYVDQPLLIPANQNTAAVTSAISNETQVIASSSLSRYQVTDSDSLESIAASNGISPDGLRAANAMIGDALIAGQYISIPSEAPVPAPPWKFSIVSGALKETYPSVLETDRFILHYQPDTFPAQDPNILAQLEMNGLVFLESLTGSQLTDPYDVYVAGSNFESPNQALRGITFSSFKKTFFLHDGTGNADDQQYIAAHELTHLFMWNTVGSPSSTMLSEGTAVYTGMETITGSDHMPIETFCAAYLQAGVLPNISSTSLSFTGHIFDLENYYASGCFVKYLVDTFGIDALKFVYHSGDYEGVYGRSLSGLESEWRTQLASVPIPTELNPTELVQSVKQLENSYSSFFYSFSGTAKQRNAYRELDQARIALLEGKLIEMQNHLNTFKSLR